MHKIRLDQLRQMIVEEMDLVCEAADDHSAIADVSMSASKLLTAILAFDKGATGPMVNAVTPHLDKLREMLRKMVETPAVYVQKNKGQKVTFKSTTGSDK